MKTEQSKKLIESNIGKKVKVKISNDNKEEWYGFEGTIESVYWQHGDFGFYMVKFKDFSGKDGSRRIGNEFMGAFNVDKYSLKILT